MTSFDTWWKSHKWPINETTTSRDIAEASWQASRESALQEILEELPKYRIDNQGAYYAEGWNDCLSKIRALIEKKMESGK